MIFTHSHRSSPWLFFALTFGWSWLFWISAALTGQDYRTFLVALLVALGGVGPAVAGISLTYLTEGRCDYWGRVLDFRRISLQWYAVILLFSPVMSGLAMLLNLLTGGSLPTFETAVRYVAQPLTLIPFAIFTLLFGPLPEEIGWRGYALDRLQARWSALAASLILGVVWSLWHLPLVFVQGTYQQTELAFGSLRFWLNYGLAIPALSIVMTWIYNNTRRSTLSAVLFHFTSNFTGELLNLPDRAEHFSVLWTVIAAIVVIIVWGAGTLTRRLNMPGSSPLKDSALVV